MPVYVCMLRGINVGGHKRIRMADLQKSFSAVGCERVKTYIQSGNVIFKSKLSGDRLSDKIEAQIEGDFGFPVSVVNRTIEEMSSIVAGNPFLRERGIDLQRLHVMFLSNAPTPEALKKLAALSIEPDRLCCRGKEIYLHLPNGAGESVLMKRPLERMLSVIPTTRNWKTVTTLSQLCKDCA